MEIRFCTVCNESIPDGEFDAGRAIVSGERSQHVACALKRTVAMSGWRSWLTFFLALFAAGVGAFLLSERLSGPREPRIVVLPAVVEKHVADQQQATETRFVAQLAEHKSKLEEAFGRLLEARLAEQGASIKEATTAAMERMLHGTSKELDVRIRAIDGLVINLQRQMADLVDWKIRIQQEADQLRRELELAKHRELAQPPPVAPTPAPDEPPPTPVQKDEAREKEIERWRKRLKDSDEDVVFTATIKLAELKALEAVPDLVLVLNQHKDFYARLGAATALGEIQAVAAVPDLIEALNDKDDLVRTAASEALHRIAGEDFNFVSGLTKNERIRIQKKWREWWRSNETQLREKLHQPPR